MTTQTSNVEHFPNGFKRLPPWFKQELPDMDKIRGMQKMFRDSKLHTVCESAKCPNMGQCWGAGVATFMILGEICTRACRFCAVKAGRPTPVDIDEPRKTAEAVKALNLRYVVITSVARDDMPDEGAEQFYQTISEIRKRSPDTKIEVLIPDFSHKIESIQRLIDAHPEVVSHNIETVRRLSPRVRPQADYDRSLDVLRTFKQMSPDIFTKTSFMLGFGETREDLLETMNDILKTGCDILTIGQYLAPTQLKRHVNVEHFYTPKQFHELKVIGEQMGFKYVMSGPLVRSSFIAEEGYKVVFEKMNAA